MKTLVITTALAVALAGGAYAQGQHGGRMSGGMGGGVSGGHPRGNFVGPSMMSRGPSGGPSNFGRTSTFNGPSSQGRTLFNQDRGNRDIRGDLRSGQLGRGDRDDMRHGHNLNNHDRDDRHLFNRADRDHDFDRDRHDRDFDRHHGVVSGNFFEHGRHFRFRRFFHGQFVFLVGFDDCTAWAWVHVAPGVWAWRPINVCIG